jgi:hypothetical protein
MSDKFLYHLNLVLAVVNLVIGITEHMPTALGIGLLNAATAYAIASGALNKPMEGKKDRET